MGEMDGHTRSHSAVCAGTETNLNLGETEMILAWYDPTNQHVSTNKDDPLFTPLGQLWPLGRIDEAVEDDLNNVRWKANYRYDTKEKNNG